MGKKEQVPALAMFVQGSLWVWSATSRGRPPDGGLALGELLHVGVSTLFYWGTTREDVLRRGLCFCINDESPAALKKKIPT